MVSQWDETAGTRKLENVSSSTVNPGYQDSRCPPVAEPYVWLSAGPPAELCTHRQCDAHNGGRCRCGSHAGSCAACGRDGNRKELSCPPHSQPGELLTLPLLEPPARRFVLGGSPSCVRQWRRIQAGLAFLYLVWQRAVTVAVDLLRGMGNEEIKPILSVSHDPIPNRLQFAEPIPRHPYHQPFGILECHLRRRQLQVGVEMVAVNLSQQTDSSDLLGGFRPVQPAEALLPLGNAFQELVSATWTKGHNEAFLARAAKYGRRGKWAMLLQGFKAALTKVNLN